jgi:hypothetical protein
LLIVYYHRPLRSRRQGRKVGFSFHFLLRGQKVKNNSPAGKIVIIDSPAFTEARVESNLHHEVVSDFHLPPSQRQMKKIMPLRTRRLCGEKS